MGGITKSVVVAGGAGTVMIAAAQTKPEDAATNIAAWLKLLGVNDPAGWLNATSTDAWVTLGGAFLLVVAAVLFFQRRRKLVFSPVTENAQQTSAFAVLGSMIKSSRVVTETGELVPDLWCVGIFLGIGNAQPDAKTLRNVSAEIGFILGPRPLAFEEGQPRVDIRGAERFLLQVGYTFSAQFVGLPTGVPVTMEAARVELAKDKLAEDISSFFVGLSAAPAPSMDFPPDGPLGGQAFQLTLHGDDVPSVEYGIVVNVMWPAREMPDLMLQPDRGAE